MSHFDVTTRRENGALVVVARGELDIAAADHLRAALAERSDGEDLLMDLRGLEFLDTSGIQVTVEAQRTAGEHGFTLRIVRAPASVQRVFELAGLEGVLPFEDDAAHG